MHEDDLRKKIAQLESINDQLLSELSHIDHLMRLVGFANGLITVKETARNMYEWRQAEDDSIEKGID